MSENTGIIDDFEDEDLLEYNTTEGSPQVVENHGRKALEMSARAEIYSTEGLDRYPSRGDTFEFWAHFNGVAYRQERDKYMLFGVQDDDDGYKVEMGQNDEDIEINLVNYGDNTLLAHESQSLPKNEWLRGVVDWGVDGTITFWIEDENGNELARVSGKDETWESGGIGWGVVDNPGDNSYFGSARIIDSTDRQAISIHQEGKEYEAIPLKTDASVEEYYESRIAPQDSGLVDQGESAMFFHEGPDEEELSLVFAHGRSGEATDSEVNVEFTKLQDAANWVVQDGGEDSSFTVSGASWSLDETEEVGGALRGGFELSSPFTVDPDFPAEIDSWVALSGDAENPDRVEFDAEQPAHPFGVPEGGESVSASVATVQFIPGENENVTEGGNPLNSGLMHVFDGATDLPVHTLEKLDDPTTFLPYGPVLDSWYYGDMRDEIAADFEEATRPKVGKYQDARGEESHENYRHINRVDVTFDQVNGTIDQSSVEIEFNEAGVQPDDDRVSLKGEENPWSVMVEHEVNGIPYDEWFGEEMRRANQEPRFYSYDTDYEYNGVEGVRVLTISGGYVGFGEELANKSVEDPVDFFSTIWDWDVSDALAKIATIADPAINQIMDWLAVVPRTWSFIEVIVLADGRRYARVWDASQYPSLFTYVDGKRQHMDKMPYEPTEKFNGWLIAFFSRAMAGLTPYQGAVERYKHTVRNPDQLRSEAETEFQATIEKLPVQFNASKYAPIMPRATVGLESETGNEVDDPTEPFDSKVSLIPSDIIESE